MPARLAILSDIHSNLPALETVAAHIRGNRYDAVYCLGDLGGYAAHPNEVIALLQQEGWPTIMGNYDEGIGFDGEECGCGYTKSFDVQMGDLSFCWTREATTEANKAWLRELPRELRFVCEGLRFVLCHGSPRQINEPLSQNAEVTMREFLPGGNSDAQADVILFGHTHVPFYHKLDGVHFVNTGSIGRPRHDPRANYAALTIADGTVTVEQIFLEYDVERASLSLLQAGLPNYFAHCLRTGGRADSYRPIGEVK